MDLAERFAKFLVHTEFSDVDESVIEYVKKLTLKWFMGILSEAQIEHTRDIILNMENEPDLQKLIDICTFRHTAR